MKKIQVVLLITYHLSLITVSCAQTTMVGMSYQGGYNNNGTIFNIDTDGHFSVQYNFNEGLDGTQPLGSLVQDADGLLYGLTSNGGFNEKGTLFVYRPDDLKITNLATFGGVAGACPMGSLIIGSNGNLYGMTSTEGMNGNGTIFECTTKGFLSVLANFNQVNGAYPVGSLVEAKDGSGNLYGMTRFGGAYNAGVIFKCSPYGELTVVHNFSGADGAQPFGSLTLADNGVLYGLTHNGGTSNGGVIFCCTMQGNYKVLQSFNSNTGALPCGNLLCLGDGYMYGTTDTGGVANCGTLFRCDYRGNVQVLANFNDSVGSHPSGILTSGYYGNIYGVTASGGNKTKANAGVVFKYNRYSSVFSVVHQFSTAGPLKAQGGLTQVYKGSELKAFASAKKSAQAALGGH